MRIHLIVAALLCLSLPSQADDLFAPTTAECREEYAVALQELEAWRKPIKGLVRQYLAECPTGDNLNSLRLLRDDLTAYWMSIAPWMKPKHFNSGADGVPTLRIDGLIAALESNMETN